MRNYLILGLLVVLCGCQTGDGGSTGGKKPNVKPSISFGGGSLPPDNSDDGLTEAERLFGVGKGLLYNPTDLLARTDESGFEYLTFGAWGKTYDLVSSVQSNGVKVYDFTEGQKEKVAQWTHQPVPVPIKIFDGYFKGPAVMTAHNSSGEITDSDYGTMYATVKDINSATNSKAILYFQFNMSKHNAFNYDPNAYKADDILWLPIESGFSEDFNNLKVDVWKKEHNGYSHYSGYGTKSSKWDKWD